MWKGIEVENLGALSTNQFNNSVFSPLIEDAITAISSTYNPTNTPNATIRVSNTVFNKNYIDVSLTGFNASNLSFSDILKVDNSVFTCRDFSLVAINPNVAQNTPSNLVLRTAISPTTGLASPFMGQNYTVSNLKSPYNNQPSHIAIQINNVGVTSGTAMYGVSIGDATPNYYNLFDSHGQFISALNSHVTVINNVFQNTRTYTIVTGSPTVITNFGGSAISHSTSTLFNSQLQLGAANVNVGNRFWNCHIGVDAKNLYRLWVENAIFRSTQSNTTIAVAQGNTGILLNTNRFEYYIGYNEFSNISSGINIPLSPNSFTNIENPSVPSTPGLFANRIRITNNVFTGKTTALANSYMSNAVNITSPLSIPWFSVINTTVSPAVNALAVTNNTIIGSYNGINVSGIKGFPSRISSNLLSLTDNTGTLFTGPQHGIKFTNSNQSMLASITPSTGIHYGTCSITENTVSFDSTPTNTAGGLIWCGFNGYSFLSPSVTCNELSSGYQGFVFENTNVGALWAGNNMSALEMGLVLDHYGIIGVQGGSTTAVANLWAGSWSGKSHTFVDVYSDATNSKLYCNTGAGLTPTNNAGPFPFQNYAFGPSYTVTGAGAGDYNCEDIPNYKPITLPNNDASFLSDDMFYMQNMAFYNLLYFNDSIRNSDAGFSDFYSTGAPASLLLFHQIEDNLYLGDYSAANGYITDAGAIVSNNVELNYVLFYQLYSKYVEFGSLSDADKNHLYNLALLCPGISGASVFQAQALFNSLYHEILVSECYESEGERKVKYPIAKENGISGISIFPNPTSSYVTIANTKENEFLTVEITDLSNRILVRQNVKATGIFVKLDFDLLNGAYLIHVTNSENESIIKKLLIAK